ncbi:MAG: hypothetical protein JWN04_332 [Myxococcaceae bacterium]|nr:hypothetical protein [Myxococcaceae bacterium]
MEEPVKVRVSLLLVATAMVFACTRDASSGMNVARDAGPEADGGQLRSVVKAFISNPPSYVVAGETYRYRPRATSDYSSLKATSGPITLTTRERMIVWTTGRVDSGDHRMTLTADTTSGPVMQQFTLEVAPTIERAAAEIGEAGGRVVASYGSKYPGVGVTIPAGALTRATSIRVSELERAPRMTNVIGEPIAIHFAPSGTIFRVPVQVALPLPRTNGLTKNKVRAYAYDPAGRWVQVPVLAVDLDNGLVTAEAQHFSIYAAAQHDVELVADLKANVHNGALVASAAAGTSMSSLRASALDDPTSSLDAINVAGAGSVRDLIQSPGFQGSLRTVQVLELVEQATQVTLESAIAVTTLYAPGDGSATVTHTDSAGNPAASVRLDRLASSVEQIEQHLQGQATVAEFATAPAPALALHARLHMDYSPNDESLDALNVRDLAAAVLEAEPSRLDSTPVVAEDQDCDGLRDAYDTSDDTGRCDVVFAPSQVVSTLVKTPVKLLARVAGNQGGDSSWQGPADEGASLESVPGEPGARLFSATTPGRYRVKYTAGSGKNAIEHAFYIDVIASVVANTAPTCAPSLQAGSPRVDQAVGLSAHTNDDESEALDLSVQWGVYDPLAQTLSSTDPLTLANDAVTFMPRREGHYVLGCRASDGQLQGEVGSVELDVLGAAENRPPRLTVSPMDITVPMGQRVTLHAWAEDPDFDALTFAWSLTGSSLEAESAGGESQSEITTSKVGTLPIMVEASDGKTTARTVIHVRVRTEGSPADDLDGDGFAANGMESGDCDDTSSTVHPGAAELCDERDNDCDGFVDEAITCRPLTCPIGFMRGAGDACEDIDECAADHGGCDPLTTCTNTSGSHVCGSCPTGYVRAAEGQCEDIDECATNHGGCDPAAACENTPGGFKCGSCPSGYRGGPMSGCVDVDECTTNNGNCDPLTSCINNVGGSACGPCPSGYTGTGETGCVKIDPCAQPCSAAHPTFAIRATGPDASIAVANTGFALGSGAWTFEFWIRAHDLFANPKGGGHLFDMNESYAAYAIRPVMTGRSIVGYTYNDTEGPWNLLMSADPLPTGDTSWHHVAITYESGLGRLYIDGVQRKTQSGAAPLIKATSAMAIGHASGYADYYAAPVSLGGIRYSRIVRYPNGTSFVPASTWPVDTNTIAQFLTSSGLAGTTLVDEAGADNNGTVRAGWVNEDSQVCPACL